MIKLYIAANLQDAKIVSDVLNNHGIHNTVRNLSSQGLGGELPIVANFPTIYVSKDDFIDAKKILNTSSIGAVWTCSCGEVLEPQFSECWNCGRGRR